MVRWSTRSRNERTSGRKALRLKMHLGSVTKLLVFVGIGAVTARGNVIATPTITSVGGVFTYSYDLSNTGSDGIFLFTLDVSGPISSTNAPAGWLASTTPVLGDILVEWGSGEPSSDVLPGSSLSGFVLTSNLPPGAVQFSALDESLNEFGGSTQGPVASPSSVPEPSTLPLVITAVAGLFSMRRYSRSVRY